QMLHVPFKGVFGSLPALIGGQVEILMDKLPRTLAQIKDGAKNRGIAVTAAERSAAVPDTPTVAESGLKGVDVTAWFALYAPKGTPPDTVQTLIDAAQDALKSEALQAKFVSLGAQAGTLVGDDLKAFEAKERERWSTLIKDRNIKTQ